MVVVTLGNFSSKLLLRTEIGITRLRGHAYPWWGRFLVPTFHPAAALRGSAQVLEEMRHDFGLVKGIVEGDIVFEQEAPPAVEGLAPGEAPPGVEELAPEGDPPGEQLGLFGSG